MALNFTQKFQGNIVFTITLYKRVENVSLYGESNVSTTEQAFEINTFIKFLKTTESQVAISLQGKEIRTEGEVFILVDNPQDMIEAGLMDANKVVLINPATDYFLYKGKKYEMLNIKENINQKTQQTLFTIPFYYSGSN